MSSSKDISERLAIAGMLVILIFATLLRLWGIDFGLPYANHPDESRFVMTAVKIIQTGDFNPGWFLQPTLYAYSSVGVLMIYFLMGVSQGVFMSVQDLFCPDYHFWGKIAYPGEFLVPRLLTALLGVLSIWAVYELGRRMFNRRVGLLAALLTALSYHHVSSSHFVTTDVPATFFALVTVIYSWLVWKEGRTRWYILAGLFAGLTASTRYNVGLVVFPLFVAHFLRWFDHKVYGLSASFVAGVLACVAGFLVGTPYALFDLPNFLDGLAYEAGHHLNVGHIGAEGNAGWWLFEHLMIGSERWLTAVGILGSLVLAKRDWRRMLFLLCFPVSYYVMMSRSLVRFERFLVPVMPFLALSAALFLDQVVRPRLSKLRWARVSFWGIVILLCLEPAVSVALYDYRLTLEDVRVTAAHWMELNLPADAVVAVERFGPPVSPERFVLVEPYAMIDYDLGWYREQGVEYFAFGAILYRRTMESAELYPERVQAYQEFFQSLELVQVFDGPYVGWPDYQITIYRRLEP